MNGYTGQQSEVRLVIPGLLQERGLQAVHQNPRVMDHHKIIRGRRDVLDAWENWPYVEVNPDHLQVALIYDVDTPNKRGGFQGLSLPDPIPNWLVENEDNDHLHLVYSLQVPVAWDTAKSREHPVRYLSDTAERLSRWLGADPRYNGICTRNPINPGKRRWPLWLRFTPFSIGELSKAIPKTIRPPRKQKHLETALARNCDLFGWAIKEAWKPRWARPIRAGETEEWLAYLANVNTHRYDNPLPYSEVKSIAKSCAKYVTREMGQYVWSERGFSRLQTARIVKRWHGHKKDFDMGERDAAIVDYRAAGYTQAEIANMVGLSQGTISRILKLCIP